MFWVTFEMWSLFPTLLFTHLMSFHSCPSLYFCVFVFFSCWVLRLWFPSYSPHVGEDRLHPHWLTQRSGDDSVCPTASAWWDVPAPNWVRNTNKMLMIHVIKKPLKWKCWENEFDVTGKNWSHAGWWSHPTVTTHSNTMLHWGFPTVNG